MLCPVMNQKNSYDAEIISGVVKYSEGVPAIKPERP
jgi:hypothetical protein